MSQYKIHLMEENGFLNNENISARYDLLKFIMINVPKHLIKENSDGVRIDLDLLDEKTLKSLYMYVCAKTGNQELIEKINF